MSADADRGTEPPNPHSPESEQEDVLGEWDSRNDLDFPGVAAHEAMEQKERRAREESRRDT